MTRGGEGGTGDGEGEGCDGRLGGIGRLVVLYYYLGLRAAEICDGDVMAVMKMDFAGTAGAISGCGVSVHHADPGRYIRCGLMRCL